MNVALDPLNLEFGRELTDFLSSEEEEDSDEAGEIVLALLQGYLAAYSQPPKPKRQARRKKATPVYDPFAFPPKRIRKPKMDFSLTGLALY